jgi:plasmid stabilization system protein ParE
MSLPFVYRAEVRDEIDQAFARYDRQRQGLGEEFLTALQRQLELIGQNPEMYAEFYRRVRGAPMRRFPYVVYYRIQTDRIEVIAVQHGSRHPRRWRSRS